MAPVRSILAAAFLGALFGCAGCTGRITPPAFVADPVPVFVIDHGRHASLVLPTRQSTMVEFAYGEWKWFAQDRTGFARAGSVMLLPSRATLGRRELRGPTTRDSILEQVPLEELHEVRVERAASDALLADLESMFAECEEEAVENRAILGMRFVPVEPAYSIGHHCNTVIAQWLRRLGCRVSAVPLHADFEVVNPSGLSPRTADPKQP